MVKPESTPPISTAEPASPSIPLDSSLRVTPIHPDLAEIKVPGGPLPSYNYHPVTCEPIKPQDYPDELRQLGQEYTSREAQLRAQEQTAKERKREDVQRAMDKKVKERDTEMKVVSKFQEAQPADIA
ncbi:unnamed protein product [Penicillium bialowiezense]